jgi:hypothetical protein
MKMRVKLSILIALLALQATLVQAETRKPVTKFDCSVADDLARRMYGRARDARLNGDEATARANVMAFWDIAEFGGKCGRIPQMASELNKTGLSRNSVSKAQEPATASPSSVAGDFSQGKTGAAGVTVGGGAGSSGVTGSSGVQGAGTPSKTETPSSSR